MGATYPKFKAAVVQAAPVYLDLDATVSRTIGLIEAAAGEGASLIAFPETWIPGYPWWIWLGSPAWGMQFVQRYHHNSLEIDSEEFESICDAARDNNIYVVLGYSERFGGSLYIGQSIIGNDGSVLGSRRKLKPTHVERSVFGEGDGSSLQVHETEVGQLGALCCWEHLQPLSKYAMYSLHEQVHVASWPSFCMYLDAAYSFGPEFNNAVSQMYAAEGQCFVLASCGVVSQKMLDMLMDSEDKASLLLKGGGYSMVYGPDGRPLAEPLDPAEEGLVYADIDVGSIAFAKAAADPVGHYSRPDVTRLLLNRNAQKCVEDMGATDSIAEEADESPARETGEEAAAATQQ